MVWEAEGASPDHSGRAFDAHVLVFHLGIRHLESIQKMGLHKTNADRLIADMCMGLCTSALHLCTKGNLH